MAGSEYDDLTRSIAERRRIFTPHWFGDLLSGRLGLGDTFWIGNYGVALIIVPILVLVPLLTAIFLGPGAHRIVSLVLYGALTVYLVLLTRAVLRTARRVPEVGGWRFAGIAITVIQAALAALFTWAFLTEGG